MWPHVLSSSIRYRFWHLEYLLYSIDEIKQIINCMATILKIDLSKIRANYQYVSNLTNTRIAAVVKAEGYGVGAIQVAKTLNDIGCREYFVSNLDEAIALRKILSEANTIYVLHGPYTKDSIKEFVHYNAIPVINSLLQLELCQDYIHRTKVTLPIILNFDIGMNRLGFEKQEINYLLKNKELLEQFDIQYLMGHLSVAEDSKNIQNARQLSNFLNLAGQMPQYPRSLANSSAIFLGKDYHFDMARIGAALYGINPYKNKSNPLLNPISLISHIIQIRNVAKGEYVGYSNSYQTQRDIKVATIPIGYADGIKRVDSPNFYVIINGKKYNIIGNISMDLATINLTHIDDNITIGTKVEIIGSNIHHDTLGRNLQTIGYEILTSFGKRYKRIYANDQI